MNWIMSWSEVVDDLYNIYLNKKLGIIVDLEK